MRLFIVLAMVAAASAAVQNLSGKMFTFPEQNDKARVKLAATKQEFSAVTVCHRSFKDLKRDHVLFSLATSQKANGFLVLWDEETQQMYIYVQNKASIFSGFDYKPNMWHSICTTWSAATGLVQMWFNGNPSVRKSGPTSNISGNTSIFVGQEQDSYGGSFNSKQAFVGMLSDVNMWNCVLSPCEIQRYVDGLNYRPGNVLNWRALHHTIIDKVLVEDKTTQCYY